MNLGVCLYCRVVTLCPSFTFLPARADQARVLACFVSVLERKYVSFFPGSCSGRIVGECPNEWCSESAAAGADGHACLASYVVTKHVPHTFSESELVRVMSSIMSCQYQKDSAFR